MANEKVPKKDSDSALGIKAKFERIKKFFKRSKKSLKEIKQELGVVTPWINLIRPNVGLLSSFGVLVGATISHSLIFPAIVFAVVAAFLISSAGIVINDYFDLDSDLVNQPQRPMPSGDISERAALLSWLFLTALGLLLAVYISQPFFTIALINVVVAFLYSWQLQNKAVVGNLADSFLAAVTFLAGGLIAGGFADLEPALIILATIAFLGNLSREIYKDVEDIRGDRRKRAETLPLIVGREKSTYLARIILILALLLAPAPFLLGYFGLIYLLLLMPVLLLSLYPIFISPKQPRRSQKILKLSMFGFMFIFLLAALV